MQIDSINASENGSAQNRQSMQKCRKNLHSYKLLFDYFQFEQNMKNKMLINLQLPHCFSFQFFGKNFESQFVGK